MNIRFTACVQSVRHQHAHGLRRSLHTASIMSCSKSNQVCIKRFRRLSISRITVSYTHCCITPQISKFKARDLGPISISVLLRSAVMGGSLLFVICIYEVITACDGDK